ncbi:Cyclophilin-like [Pedococcus dokdonensis]|uniref:Cyclophilin-like n=1 Tax=Pedococcus dokdonensis TaxID=443156 RepID=A0A1H0URN3_9MICO|nr:cyclophilin-like fold protein [Pedococcus dokdonensis]SDP68476.1 Cyclophilin-like [Pedococcus dokdonensis]
MKVSHPRGRTGGLLTVATMAAVLALTGCDATTQPTPRSDVTDRHTSQQGSQRDSVPDRTSPAPTTSTASGDRDNAPTQEGTMQIDIRVGNEHFIATLTDTPAADDLMAQLPQTVRMSDHGGVEKTGPLRAPLNLAGQPAGADPDVGDLGYYAPGQDLVLYYGDQSYYDGIVILGTLEPGAATRLAAMPGDVQVTVTVHGS